MFEFITVVGGASILALAASLFIARVARYSPLANIAIGSVTVIIGFTLLALIFIALQRMAFG